MDELNFINFLKLNLKVKEDHISLILKNCKIKEVKKHEFLLRANEHCKHSFFVEKGLLRQFSIDERGKEHILSFAPENWFVTDRTSSYFNLPSAYNIQALEASRVVLIDETFIGLLSEKIKRFVAFNNRLLQNILGIYKNE